MLMGGLTLLHLSTCIIVIFYGISRIVFGIEIRNDGMELLPSHPEDGGEFGSSVGIHGNQIIVGSRGTNSVYIYSFNGKTLIRYEKISREENKLCGISVAIEKDIAVFTCDVCGNDRQNLSCAYVMKFNGTSWIEQAMLTDLVGYSVQINDKHVYVSNRRYHNESVSVSIYKYYNESWTLETNILSNDIQGDGMNGDTISAYGSYLAIGSSLYDLDNNQTDTGRVHVYEREGNTWRKSQTIDAPNPIKSGQFGVSIDISVDRLAVVYLRDSSTRKTGRSVRVYKRNGTFWKPEGKLVASDVGGRASFGNSIAISGNDITVGAHGDEELGYDSGSVYLFSFINGTWMEVFKFLPMANDLNRDGQGDRFGISVAIDNGIAIVGSDHSDNQGKRQSGSAYVFYLQSSGVGSTNSSLVPIQSNKSVESTMFSIKCSEHNVTGYWSKTLLSGRELQISLLDSACSNYTANETTIWLTTAFDACGSTTEEHDDVIIQKNVATIFMTKYIGGIVRRSSHHKYKMECIFPREKNVSLHDGYNVTDVAIEKLFNISSVTGFDVHLSLYRSSSFLLESIYPIEVSMDEPIYIGINKAATNKDIKIIVNKCFATSTANMHGEAYIFFLEKCPLDKTFKMIQSDANNFNFVINTFKFIKLSEAVFIHCKLLICTRNSMSEECDQACKVKRKRRSPDENVPSEAPDVKKVTYISSGRINFVAKRRCKDHICPSNSNCFDAFPAVCRCNAGYVLLPTSNTCTNNRILKLQNLHTRQKWLHSYANPSSIDFIRLAEGVKRNMMELFIALNLTEVRGVKISDVRKGSVILDLLISYSEKSSKENIYQTFLTRMKNDNTTKALFQKAGIIVGSPVTLASSHEDVEQSNDITIFIAVGVLSVLVFVITVAVIFKIVLLKRGAAKCRRASEFNEMNDLKVVFERNQRINNEVYVSRNTGFVRKRTDSAINMLTSFNY